ncbi:cupin domain-containing protein [Telluribacter sp.]|jgi:(S)-ureidoglycine aminohydrolase|uniref:cupin domain-containing protein n=1 Tax=Telluribacter sp. TaxID=1978767 RepID=UPI002E0F0727|nr:cupin domain-containing protein [Telluribacter sp.]
MKPHVPFSYRYLLLLFFLVAGTANAQYAQVPSAVYRWDVAPVSRKANSEQRVLLEGATPHFTHLKIHATTVEAGQAPHDAHAHPDEELVIVKEGRLTITFNGKTELLEAGSIALFMPGDRHGFENRSTGPVTYYIMRYESASPQPERGTKAGGSFVKHWKDLEYKTHDKGGRRNVFDRATAHSERFEMHTTTLNAGLMSHPPHTHRAAEILLLIEGQAEESIDGKWTPAAVGDIIFLQSQVPHAIRNTGSRPCTYFAFQFE